MSSSILVAEIASVLATRNKVSPPSMTRRRPMRSDNGPRTELGGAEPEDEQ